MVSTPKGIASDQEVKEDKGPEVSWVLTSKGRGQKRVKYRGDDTGKELEESMVGDTKGDPTEGDTKEDEEILEQGPPKHRRTSETPARETAPAEKETFLQVFKRFMETRVTKAPNVGKMVQGPTPVRVKIKRIEQGVLGPNRTPGKPIGKGKKKGEKGKDSGPGAEKQRRIQEFFEKRTKVQYRTEQDPGESSNKKGATVSSPLLGVSGCLTSKLPSNGGPEPSSEVRGGKRVQVAEKRKNILEFWARQAARNSVSDKVEARDLQGGRREQH